MALRTSLVVVAGVTIFGLMFQSLSRQASTTDAQTNSEVFNGTTAIMQDIFGFGGSQFPMLVVVAFVAGVLATVLMVK